MRLQTNLVRRGTRYYFRGRVPRDLEQHYGKSELLISLRTSDRQQANHALVALKARLFDEFARLRGEVTPQIVAPSTARMPKEVGLTLPQPESAGPTVGDLVDYWATQGEKRPRTLMEANTARRRLQEVTGVLLAHQIEKRHVVALKDALLSQGLSVATIKKQLNLLKAVFEVAVSNDLVPSNPFRGVKLVKPKVEQKARVPFDSDDLKRIFSSPVFTQGERPAGGRGEAAVWIPRIALWTGMRLEEIGQLTVADIKEADGIPFIHVTDAGGEGKKLKTASSRRRIPIHPVLIAEGFLDYVAQMRAERQIRLFPLVSSTPGLQVTAMWSKWFGRYLRKKIGIKDRRKCFHSFRHGFKDTCRSCGIPKEIHDQLTGHTSGDVGDLYGGDEFPIQPLAAAIAKINYPSEREVSDCSVRIQGLLNLCQID